MFCEQRKIWLSMKKDPDFEVDGYKNFIFLSKTTGRNLYPVNIRKTLQRMVNMNDTREIQLPNISPHDMYKICRSRNGYQNQSVFARTKWCKNDNKSIQPCRYGKNKTKKIMPMVTPKFTPICSNHIKSSVDLCGYYTKSLWKTAKKYTCMKTYNEL